MSSHSSGGNRCTYLVAGETSLSKDEVLKWCEKWAVDKVYVTIGQNCWSMVHDFLEETAGCYISKDLE
jgi:hypothetical protein